MKNSLGKLPTTFRSNPAAWSNAAAWWLWGIYGLTIILQTRNDPPDVGNVCGIYFQAGADFLAGRPLYSEPEPRFLYFPSAACFFTLFAHAPFTPMAVLWRFANLTLFSVGVFSLARAERVDGSRVSFLQTSIIACMLSIGATKLGQMTLAMAGLLMLAAVNLERSRFWRASLFMALAVAFKPISLPFLLLATVAYRASILRTLLFLLVMFLLPFLFQDSAYIFAQYADVPHMLNTTARNKESIIMPSLIGLIQAIGVSFGNREQLIVRLLCAIAALWVYIVGKSRLQESADRSLFLYGIYAGFLLLLSPGTEKNTYAMLAPVVGVLWCLSRSHGRRFVQVVLGLVVLSSLLSHALQVLLKTPLSQMVKPLGAVVVMAVLIQKVFSQPGGAPQQNAEEKAVAKHGPIG